MTEPLITLASCYRAAQLYAHMAHNVTYGQSFYQDHKAFKGLYEDYEAAYDALIERAIGLGADPDFAELTSNACEMFYDAAGDRECVRLFKTLLTTESQIRECIDNALKDQSQGTINFLQGLADQSEQRTYKLKQRLK